MAEKKKKKRIRKRHLYLAEASIVSQPDHSPDKYVELFERMAASKLFASYHGQRVLEVGHCEKIENDDKPLLLAGEMFLYSEINFDEPWLNRIRGRPATQEELAKINIPDEFRPEFKFFRFTFVPRSHKLYFEHRGPSGSINPKLVSAALNKLFLKPEIRGPLAEVICHLQTSAGAVESILSMEGLRRLDIEVFRPNPEDEPFEEKWMKDMNGAHISKMGITALKAPGAEAIVPMQFLRDISKLAGKVGTLTGFGKKDGSTTKKSTEDEPKMHPITYPNTEDPYSHMTAYIYDQETKGKLGE